MEYIDSLLIMEDDLTDDLDNAVSGQQDDMQEDIATVSSVNATESPASASASSDTSAAPGPTGGWPDWCVCKCCLPMPQAVENKCCGLRTCITTSVRFAKLCLDSDVLELCIRNIGDIRNDCEDNSTRAFRKAAYRQFILARHGHLGKGNRRVCPSCVVLKIRAHYPSVTGIYMGFWQH